MADDMVKHIINVLKEKENEGFSGFVKNCSSVILTNMRLS